MTVVIFDRDVQRDLIRERQALGLDRFDEVWDGVYVVSPLPNEVHQEIVGGLVAALSAVVRYAGLGKVYPGINVSDREQGWEKNYRCPDVAVYLRGNQARPIDTHWVGGPDFAVEILSPGEEPRQKFDFYAAVGVRELLIIDRDPWGLELFRLREGSLEPAGAATLGQADPIRSGVVPLAFRLVAGAERPMVEARALDGGASWLA